MLNAIECLRKVAVDSVNLIPPIHGFRHVLSKVVYVDNSKRAEETAIRISKPITKNLKNLDKYRSFFQTETNATEITEKFADKVALCVVARSENLLMDYIIHYCEC